MLPARHGILADPVRALLRVDANLDALDPSDPALLQTSSVPLTVSQIAMRCRDLSPGWVQVRDRKTQLGDYAVEVLRRNDAVRSALPCTMIVREALGHRRWIIDGPVMFCTRKQASIAR